MRLVIILLISLVSINFSLPQEKVTVDSTFREKFDPERDAAKDIKNAVIEAKKTGKRILLDVGGEWCIWCHRLDQFYVDNKGLNYLLNKNFVVVKVNYSPENKNEKLLSKYPKIPGYPHYFVLNTKGKFLYSQGTGDLEKDKGYDKDKVAAFLKKWGLKGNG